MQHLRTNIQSLSGTLQVPGDKSISHRAVMLGSIANGKTTITGFLPGEDCLSTIACFEKMGVSIDLNGDQVVVEGKGLDGLIEPSEILDVGNSGTTTRLILGILASRPFHSVIIGDESIGKRPMSRVTKPLTMMDARIDGRNNGNYTPLSVRGGNLSSLDYYSPVASAQVKSCILLAGLGATGITTLTEPSLSRDHTERMLQAFGAEITRSGLTVSIKGGQSLTATDILVPGDISSAAFFLVAGAIIPNSELTLHNVGINPTRTGIIDVLFEMGADLTIANVREENNEPIADLTIRTSALKGMEIGGDLIPRLIDELPIIALLATQAEGKTIIKNAEELKVKETNRIDTVVSQFEKLGATIKGTDDGMIIEGKTGLHGADVDSFGDHRIGMTMAIAACIASGEMALKNADAISVSYPNFFKDLDELIK